MLAMGWDFDSLNLSGIDEKKMLKMVGESLHLGCVGIIFYLIFLTEEGPWWDNPKGVNRARPVDASTAASSTSPAPKASAKRARRSGCLPLARPLD
jgi:hypothetical protein